MTKFRKPSILKHRASTQRRRGESRARTAATMVEFAIVANLLFLIVFTCIEFARMNMVRNLTQDAAYFAARQAIVPGATSAEADATATQIMASMVDDGVTVNVSALDDESEEVSVTVSVDLDSVALFTPMFLGNKTISATAVMRTERYAGFYEQ